MRKKLFAYALSGALALGTIGGTAVYAAESADTTATTESTEQHGHGFEELDEATKIKVQEIQTRVAEELEALGVTVPEKGDKQDLFAGLDEDVKAKAEAILNQEKADTLTREEAQAQLEDLGVSLPEKREKQDLFADLDEATKEKAQAIVDDAEAELAELGVDRPVLGNGHHHGMGRR